MSDTNTTEPRKIIINLNNSREASRLEKNEIIQQEALDQFENLIEQIKGRIDNFTTNLNSDDPIRAIRTHDVITVDGRRGSGKTTFILSAFESLEDETKKDICFLDIIDPTLIETREHVFVTIVSLIKRKVDNAYKNSCTKSNEDKYKAWRKSLEELANGMRLLDGIGQNHLKSDSWMDEHFALEHGIQNSQSGRDLELSFHRYIAASLDFIGQKAFLIAFDDIDTDFSKGWPVLEMIRKYLTTPQLITVLSGDLQLYSTLVEKQQWENLGLGFNTDNEKQNQFRPMIEELVDQYLLKILTTSHRIELKPVGHYLSNSKHNIEVVRDKTNTELKFVLGNLCKDILCIQNKNIHSSAIKQIVELPTRTIVSLLISLEKFTHNNWTLTNIEKRPPAIQALSDVFLSWLQRLGFHRQDFEQTDTLKIISTVLKNMVENDLMPEAAELKAIFKDQGHNNAILVLNAFLTSSMTKNSVSFIDYMYRISLTANVMEEIPNTELSKYIRHTGLLEGENTINIARKYIAFMWHVMEERRLKASSRLRRTYPLSFPKATDGTYRLYADSTIDSTEENNRVRNYMYYSNNKNKFEYLNKYIETQKPKPSLYFNTPSTLYNSITSWQRYIAMLPISNVRVGDRTYPHFSFFNLLGSINQLINTNEVQSGRTKKHNRNNYTIENNTSIQHQLMALSVIRDYSTSSANNVNFTQEESYSKEGVFEFNSALNDPIIPSYFKNSLRKWERASKDLETNLPQPASITKSWKRFYYALKNISEKVATPKSKTFFSAGNIMHRWVVLFLNSLLVEEAISNGFQNLKLNNPITSDAIFISNLNAVYNVKNNTRTRGEAHIRNTAPLFEWIFTCPVWAFFLDNNQQTETFDWYKKLSLRKNIFNTKFDFEKMIIPEYNNSQKNTASLFDLLNSLAMLGMKQDKRERDPSIKINNFEIMEERFYSLRHRALPLYKQVILYIGNNHKEIFKSWNEESYKLTMSDVKDFLIKYFEENTETKLTLPKTINSQNMEKVFSKFKTIIAKEPSPTKQKLGNNTKS